MRVHSFRDVDCEEIGIALAVSFDTMRPMNTDRRDRVIQWQDEWLRALDDLPNLPAGAQRAVLAVGASFAHEDGEEFDGTTYVVEDAA